MAAETFRSIGKTRARDDESAPDKGDADEIPRPDCGMATKIDDYNDVAQWPLPVETEFIHMLHKEVKKGLQTSTLDKKSWVTIDTTLFSKYGKRYTVPKLKSKYNRLRKLHREFGKLLDHTGMSWDPDTNTIHASDEIWDAYLKKNTFAKRFRRKGLHNYQILGEIFNNTIATGQMHYASTQEPPHSDDERQLEGEFLHAGIHVDIKTDGDMLPKGKATIGHGTRRRAVHKHLDQHSKKEGRSSKLLHLDDNLKAWTKSAKTEASLAKAYCIRNQEATSSYLYSIDACMDALEALEDVADEAYNKACEKFLVVEWRNMFMKMSDERKKKWINGLK